MNFKTHFKTHFKKTIYLLMAIIVGSSLLGGNIYTSTVANGSMFGLNGSSSIDQTSQFKAMLSSNYEVINLASGTYKLSDTMFIYDGVPKKIIGGTNTVLSVNLSSSRALIRANINISYENITFDFNNGPVSTALLYPENQGIISLKNIKIKNVKDMNNTNSSVLLSISPQGNVLDIDGIEFNSIKKLGNGKIGDAAGNISGIYINPWNSTGGIVGSIKNVTIREMHSINSAGDIILEDTSGIYAYAPGTTPGQKLVIDGVNGYNSGKRLLKIDTSNIEVKNVTVHNTTGDQLCAIGINDGVKSAKNITLDNITITGLTNIGVALYGEGTTLTNSHINITDGSWGDSIAILVAGNNMKISNTTLQADRGVMFYETVGFISNVELSNMNITINPTGTHTFQVNGNSNGFKNVTLSNISSTMLATPRGRYAFFAAEELDGSTYKKSDGLTINDCSITTYSPYGYGIFVNYINDIHINNFTYISKTTDNGNSAVTLNACSNGTINNLNTLTPVSTALTINGSANISVNGIASRITDPVKVSNSTNISLVDIYRTTPLTSEPVAPVVPVTPETPVVPVSPVTPTPSEPQPGDTMKTDDIYKVVVEGPTTITNKESFQFKATVYKNNQATNEPVQWYISANNHVTCDTTGLVTVFSTATYPTVRVGARRAYDKTIIYEKLVNIEYNSQITAPVVTPPVVTPPIVAPVIVPEPKANGVYSVLITGPSTITNKASFKFDAKVYNGELATNEPVQWYITANNYVDLDTTGLVTVLPGSTLPTVKVGARRMYDKTIIYEKLVMIDYVNAVVPPEVITPPVTPAPPVVVPPVTEVQAQEEYTVKITGPTSISAIGKFQFKAVVYKGSVATDEPVQWYISANNYVDMDSKGVVWVLEGATLPTFIVGARRMYDKTNFAINTVKINY